MDILPIVVLAVIISTPLEASTIVKRNAEDNDPAPWWRRYFGKPNSHFKYKYIPMNEGYERAKDSKETDSYIEKLIRDSLRDRNQRIILRRMVRVSRLYDDMKKNLHSDDDEDREYEPPPTSIDNDYYA